MSKLEEHNCIECDLKIKLPMTLPYEGEEKPTGMSISMMDEDGGEHILGTICFECSDKLCKEGTIAVGYAGYPHSWDATQMKRGHVYPFLEKNRVKCRCDQCMKEEYEEDADWL